MKKLFVLWAVVSFTTVFMGNIYAQNLNDVLRLAYPGTGTNARALGMGNAYIGISDDASASAFNPAGLGLIRKIEFAGGLNYYNYSNDASLSNLVRPMVPSNSTNHSNSSTNLDQVSLVFPYPTLRGSLVFGISYNSVKDYTGALKFSGYNGDPTSFMQAVLSDANLYALGLEGKNNSTPLSGRLTQNGEINESGRLNNFTLSAAAEVSPNLFIGANLDFISGKYEKNNDYYESDIRGYYNNTVFDPDDANTVGLSYVYINRLTNWDISGWDLKLGMLYQYKDIARFGATVQFPKDVTVKEDFKVYGQTAFLTGIGYKADLGSDHVEYDVISPYVISGGGAVNYNGFIFSCEASITDYTQAKFDNANNIDAQTIADYNREIKNVFRTVFSYNLGVEYTFPQIGLRLRGGYFMQPSAYKDDPSDFNKKYLTAGLGFLIEDALELDFAFAHGFWKDAIDNYTNYYGDQVSHVTQDISYNKAVLTATFRF